MRKNYLLYTLLLVLLFSSCRKELAPGVGLDENGEGTPGLNTPGFDIAGFEFVDNEILVKFKEGTPETGRANALKRINAKAKEHILTAAMKRAGASQGVFLLETMASAAEAIRIMKSFPEVEYAEPNYIYRHTLESKISNDNCYLRLPGNSTNLWGMYSNDKNGSGVAYHYGPANNADGSITGFLTSSDFGSWAEKAWAAGHIGSSNVVVGVIDEGIDHTHPDFKHTADGSSNIENASATLSYPQLGYDPYPNDTWGWNFVTNTNQVYTPNQDQHGTHVAGTIGAVGGNEIAVAGVCWNVKIISAKFLATDGGTTANAIKAVDYFTDLKTNFNLNLVAINNSWGGGGYSQGLYDAIQRANNKGILFVAAAGNGNFRGVGINIDKTKVYPASYTNSNVVSVAAINSVGALRSSSNYGAKSVHLGAPGEWIYSTFPLVDASVGYQALSGTSMAAPHVTGAVALLAATENLAPRNAADIAVIKARLLDAARRTPTSSLNGKTVTNGRLNVSRLLNLE